MQMTAKEVIKKLKESGWTFREGKRHTIAASPDGTRKTQIPRHTGDIAIGTLKAIERDTGIPMK
jgi:predicted RNA binding protein YcfA (HicA-like mRNA interferase family)